MTVKEKFINDLIKELNNINLDRINYSNVSSLDVCYMVSVLDQQLEECKEFLDDITRNRYCINGYDKDTTGGYTNGKIRVLIEKPEEEKESEMMYDAYYDYCYFIEFFDDQRYWGYCDCTPEDDGYNEKHGCCGNGCDWVAPAFRIEKVISLNSGSWNGVESDYWEYKKQFEVNEDNKNKEVEEYKKQQEKRRLESQLEELQKKLKELK